MQQKRKPTNLFQPKLTPISKQQYRKFYQIRKLNTELCGPHLLLSHNHKKYIQKQLPISSTFLTTRPSTQPIYSYTEDSNNIYIFHLLGEPLVNLWRGCQGKEIKQWVNRCGGLEAALIEVIRVSLSLFTDFGIQDLIIDCFRVGDGKLVYCYDTWMKNTSEIVKSNNLEIQNYFLSEMQLKWLQATNLNKTTEPTLPMQEYLFKIGLMILNLSFPELKTRTYEYCQYSFNYANIQEKIKLFKVRIANKELQNLVCKFIGKQIDKVEEVWKILDGGRGKRGDSLGTQFSSKKASNSKNWDKQNSILILDSQMQKHSRKYSTATKCESSLLFQKGSSSKKIRLRGRSGNINDSSLNMSNPIIEQPVLRSFSLKQVLLNLPAISHSNEKLSQFLGLAQHITECLYQKSIILALETMRVKADWKQKTYTNGSIYFGEMVEDKRVGKGLYLFDSEDLYVGDWMENMMNGNGIYVFKSGELYDGGLSKGLRSGYGKFSYKDGRVYEGHWQDNLKVGFGTVTFPNNTKFLGFFQKTAQTYGLFTQTIDGQLIQTQGNLESYNWQTNSFSTTSESNPLKLKLRNQSSSNQKYEIKYRHQNSKYIGDRNEQNTPNGYGIKQSEEQIYEGWWKNGKEDGEGKLVVKGKFQVQGVWRDGMMVEYGKKRCI